ncbi:MAG: hypothetical protein ACC662_10900, partial [Planctomycetota bacterium]
MRTLVGSGMGLLLLALLPLVLWADEAKDAKDVRPWSERPFLGLSVRDTPEGLVVAWIHPGPLGGRGFESEAGLRRGDNVVSIDGKRVDAAGFKALVEAHAPGEEIENVWRRS